MKQQVALWDEVSGEWNKAEIDATFILLDPELTVAGFDKIYAETLESVVEMAEVTGRYSEYHVNDGHILARGVFGVERPKTCMMIVGPNAHQYADSFMEEWLKVMDRSEIEQEEFYVERFNK